MSGPFLGIYILADFRISKKKKKIKKLVISDIVLCVLCMWVLHGSLQIIPGDFNCFPRCIVLSV